MSSSLPSFARRLVAALAWLLLSGLLVAQTSPGAVSGRVSDADTGKSLHAQSSPAVISSVGAIKGTVSNAATHANLEGAQVTLEPGNIAVLTSPHGLFDFPQVPVGQYSLTVSYAGLDAKTFPVRVEAGATVVQDVGLIAEVYLMSPFVVSGEREGNALAITLQRNAPNVKNVLSSDAFGNVADLNLGNFMLRLPGVSKEESEGEIIRVQIRGVNSNLNAVSIDGTRAANGSTRAFERGFEIDKIPTDFIETVEVTKAMTPDMDADSIGGAVNLKTKSALDRKGRRITYQVGNSYNERMETFRPLGSLSYSDLLGAGRKLGVMFTASYNESHKPRDNSNIDYERTTATDRPVYFSQNIWGEDQLKHTRGGVGLRLDYRLTSETTVYLNAMYSLYEDKLSRRRGGLGTPAAANVKSVTNTVTETQNQTFTFTQLFRDRDLRTFNYQAGGESNFWGGKLDFNANYSPSRGTERRVNTPRTVAGTGFRQDRSETHNWLKLTQISGPDIFDWRNSTFSTLDIPTVDSRDRIVGAQVNLRKPFDTRVPFAIKTGFRLRAQTREKDQGRNLYSYVGPNGVAGPVGAANDDNLVRFFDTGYDYAPWGFPHGLQFFNLPLVMQELRTSPGLFKEDILAGTRDSVFLDNKASETVGAGYVMADIKLGRLGIVTGLRVEDTRVRGNGHKQEITAAEKARRAAWVGTVTPEETVRRTLAEYNNPTEATGHYRDVFPSIHLKYLLAKGLIARASYSTGIGRPNFGQIVPDLNINNDNLTITANNPDLRPQYSDNFDATLEYYFNPAGLVSVGVFQKKIRDFIFRQSAGTVDAGSIYGDAYRGYLLTTDFNGGSARIRGLEVSYQQQFSSLPGLWRGFGLFANFTWLESKGDYGTPGATFTQSELENFTPRSGNAGVSYIAHGWTVRTKMNFSGHHLITYNADPSRRAYLTDSKPVDLNVAYAVNSRLSLFMDVINVFDTPTNHEYTFIPDRKTRTVLYTTIIKFGVNGSF